MKIKMPKIPVLNNEDGSLMLMALLIMATLAIAGTLVTKDSRMERKVARNYAFKKQTLYAASSAALDFIANNDLSVYNDIANGVVTGGYALASQGGTFPDIANFNASDWGTTYPAWPGNLKTGNTDFDYIGTAEAIAVYTGTINSAAMGLGLGSSGQLHSYIIYGRAVHGGIGNNSVIIAIGYRTPV